MATQIFYQLKADCAFHYYKRCRLEGKKNKAKYFFLGFKIFTLNGGILNLAIYAFNSLNSHIPFLIWRILLEGSACQNFPSNADARQKFLQFCRKFLGSPKLLPFSFFSSYFCSLLLCRGICSPRLFTCSPCSVLHLVVSSYRYKSREMPLYFHLL